MLFFYAVFRVRLVLFRHLQDCHNIFFRQRLEEANVSVSAENAFLSHFLDLGIGWINAKFSEGGWPVSGVAPIFPGGHGKKGSGLYGRYCICRFWDTHIENFFPQTVQICQDWFCTYISPSFPRQLQVRLRELHQTYRRVHAQSYVWRNQIPFRHRSDRYGKGFRPT